MLTGAEQSVARRLCHERSEPRPPGESARKDRRMLNNAMPASLRR